MHGGQQTAENVRVEGPGEGFEETQFVDDQRAGRLPVEGREGGTPEGWGIEGPRRTRSGRWRKGGRDGRLDLERATRGAKENVIEKSIQGRGESGIPGT